MMVMFDNLNNKQKKQAILDVYDNKIRYVQERERERVDDDDDFQLCVFFSMNQGGREFFFFFLVFLFQVKKTVIIFLGCQRDLVKEIS